MLGLARSLRASGHDARVLGAVRRAAARRRRHAARQQHPDRRQRLDRPARARRRRRSCAPSGRCATRSSTSSTSTSRSRPGATMTACVLRAGAAGRHVPRRRRPSASYRWAQPGVRWLAGRLDLRCAVSEDAEALASTLPRRRLRAGLQRHRGRAVRQGAAHARPTARRSSSSAATRTAKGLTCCSRRMASLPARRPAVGRRRRARDRRGCGPGRRRPADRVARADHRGREALAPAGRRRLLRAVAAGRVVRRGAARGHGGRDRRSSPATCAGYRQVARPDRDARARARRATPRRWPPALEPRARRPRAGPRRWWPRARSGCRASRWTAWPSATSSSTSGSVASDRLSAGPAAAAP